MSRHVITALSIALLAIPAIGSSTLGATPSCGGLEATIVGTNKAELLRGTGGRDVIVAKDGNDWVNGGGGNDVICGGDGRDMLLGESGDDRTFGNRGDDTLKGGRAFDRLAGGDGADACYRGAGGGKLIACEGADLRVRISAPTSVAEGAGISYTVRVRNIGVKPSTPFQLAISEDQHGIDCGSGLSVEDSWPKLAPGAWAIWVGSHPAGCEITGADPYLDIHAEVDQPSADEHPANDDDSARVHIAAP